MKIRQARIDDIASLQVLSIQLGYEYPMEKMEQKLGKILDDPDHRVLVALDNANIVGYIHIERYQTFYADDLINILGIVVDTSCRGKGIGTALLHEAEQIAKELNAVGIRANSASSRIQAHEFYRKNGFSSEKDQKRFIKSV